MRILHSTPPSRPRAGYSLIEVLLAILVLSGGTLVLSKTLAASVGVADATRERSAALEAARRVLEELQDETFSEVFARYNATPDDDPAGAASPGAGFAVEGLSALESDADGMVGEIVFPVQGGELREDVELFALGMPRDLDGLNGIDDADHSGDYALLPVLVRVVWRGSDAPMQVELRTILAQR